MSWRQWVVLKNMQLSNSAEIEDKTPTEVYSMIKRNKRKTSVSHELVLSGRKGLRKVKISF